MDRFFAPAGSWEEGRVVLERAESHHCLRVLRKRVGDEIEVFDGSGRWARGVIAGIGSELVEVSPRQEGRDEEELPLFTLAVAIAKGKVMDLIVQKAVELGVNRVQPLITENTVVRLDGSGDKKRDKWRRTALEACKQCGRNHLAEIGAVLALEDYLAGRHEARSGLLASLREGATSLKHELRSLPSGVREVALLIGPEGDLSPAEYEAVLEGGFAPVSFGERTLRMETAVIFGLSALHYELR